MATGVGVNLRFEVVGVSSLIGRLLHGKTIANEAMVAGALDMAEQVAEIARGLVPVDTGTLQDSIHVNNTPHEGLISVEADAEYASFVEYGTSVNDAQPFMRPAADQVDTDRAMTRAGLIMEQI